MSAYQISELVNKWERGDLSNEQAIGQLILQAEALSERMGTVEKRLEQSRQQQKTAGTTQPNRVAFDADLLQRAQNLALIRGLSTESLVNLLLEQRLHQLETQESLRD
jgi:hypothetical protein